MKEFDLMRHYNFTLSDLESRKILSVLTDVIYEKKVRLHEYENGEYPDIMDSDSVNAQIRCIGKDVETLGDFIYVLDSAYRNDIQEKLSQFEMNNDV